MSENLSPKISWKKHHKAIYEKLLNALVAEPATPPIDSFYLHRVPQLLRATYGSAHGYVTDENNALTYREVFEGDRVVFWNGDEFETGPFTEAEHWLGDYNAIAHRIIDLANGRDVLVLDIGAGTCLQALALRAADSLLPVLNLDYFPMLIGEKLCEQLDIRKVAFCKVDINTTLSHEESASALKSIILRQASGRPIIIVSRMAIFGFISEAEYQRLFAFLITDVKAEAGLHLEICGHKTATFQKMQDLWGSEIHVAPKSLGGEGDPLAYLEYHSNVEIIERLEVWPHQMITRFPSFISWKRR